MNPNMSEFKNKNLEKAYSAWGPNYVRTMNQQKVLKIM